jgi:hypothetical protein
MMFVVSAWYGIFGIFLGLVIQVSQVIPLAATPLPVCGVESTSCCDGAESCPCLNPCDDGPSPAPIAPAPTTSAKQVLCKNSPALDPPSLRAPPGVNPNAGFSTALEGYRGFKGVTLSVAFCRFVI